VRKVISLSLIFALLLPSTMLIAEPYQRGITYAQLIRKDWYGEGRQNAVRDYKGGPAELGGFAAGLCFGLLGWGVGHLIVSGLNIDVPQRYIVGLNAEQRLKFEDGYSNYISRERRGRFNDGAAKGCLALAVTAIYVYLTEYK